MKRWILGSLAFVFALATGVFATFLFMAWDAYFREAKTQSCPHTAERTEPIVALSEEECPVFKPEFLNLPDWEEVEYPDTTEKVLDYFEIDAIDNHIKARERMLVFGNDNGQLSLKYSRVSLKRRSTEHGQKMVDLRFNIPGKPILAFRNFGALKERPVQTVFVEALHVGYVEQEGRLEKPFMRSFSFMGTDYSLRVSSGQRKNGERAGVLVLAANGTEQIIHIGPHWPDVGPSLGDLVWAGDMDGDNKLDLLINHNSSEEGSGSSLFLSSQAVQGQLVKLAAVFGGGGC